MQPGPARRLAHRAVLVAVLAAAPAAAEERPPFPPSRDVAVTYRVQDERGRQVEMQVAWSAALRSLRAETRAGDATVLTGGLPVPAGAHLLLDLRAGRAVAAEARSGLSLDLPRIGQEARRGETLLAGARFLRVGAARIAGLACTEWRIEPAPGQARGTPRPILACLTREGVPLRAREEGRPARADAIAVAFAPQDPARFAPPRGGLQAEAAMRALGGLLDRPGGAAGALQSLRDAWGGAGR